MRVVDLWCVLQNGMSSILLCGEEPKTADFIAARFPSSRASRTLDLLSLDRPETNYARPIF